MVFALLQQDDKDKSKAGKLLDGAITKLVTLADGVDSAKAAAKTVTDDLRLVKLKNVGTWKT